LLSPIRTYPGFVLYSFYPIHPSSATSSPVFTMVLLDNHNDMLNLDESMNNKTQSFGMDTYGFEYNHHLSDAFNTFHSYDIAHMSRESHICDF
jgi:hypothetical protein